MSGKVSVGDFTGRSESQCIGNGKGTPSTYPTNYLKKERGGKNSMIIQTQKGWAYEQINGKMHGIYDTKKDAKNAWKKHIAKQFKIKVKK